MDDLAPSHRPPRPPGAVGLRVLAGADRHVHPRVRPSFRVADRAETVAAIPQAIDPVDDLYLRVLHHHVIPCRLPRRSEHGVDRRAFPFDAIQALRVAYPVVGLGKAVPHLEHARLMAHEAARGDAARGAVGEVVAEHGVALMLAPVHAVGRGGQAQVDVLVAVGVDARGRVPHPPLVSDANDRRDYRSPLIRRAGAAALQDRILAAARPGRPAVPRLGQPQRPGRAGTREPPAGVVHQPPFAGDRHHPRLVEQVPFPVVRPRAQHRRGRVLPPRHRVVDRRLREADPLAFPPGVVHVVPAAIRARDDRNAIGPGVPRSRVGRPVDRVRPALDEPLRCRPLLDPVELHAPRRRPARRRLEAPSPGIPGPGAHQAQATAPVDLQIGPLPPAGFNQHRSIVSALRPAGRRSAAGPAASAAIPACLSPLGHSHARPTYPPTPLSRSS